MKKILFIEDDTVVRENTAELLELAKLSNDANEDNKQKIQQLSRISESTNEAIQLITKRIEEISNNFTPKEN